VNRLESGRSDKALTDDLLSVCSGYMDRVQITCSGAHSLFPEGIHAVPVRLSCGADAPVAFSVTETEKFSLMSL